MSLVKLPVELILLIAEHLDLDDHCSWARASRRFHRILGGKEVYERAHELDSKHHGWPRYLSKTIWSNNLPAFLEMLQRTSDINNQRVVYTNHSCYNSPIIGTQLREGVHRTLLHLASELGREEMVRRLLEKGADVSIIDCLMHTPLHVATRNRQIGVARLLIEGGAAVSAEIGATGLTALDYAVSGNSAALVKLLLKKGAVRTRPETLQYAAFTYCKTGDPTILRILIKEGIKPSALKSRAGVLALYGAILHRHLLVAQLLIDAGVELTWNRRLHLGIPSALRLAVLRGDQEMERFLIESSALFRVSRMSLWWQSRLEYDCHEQEGGEMISAG
ncbi:hypothetical protein VTN77DRAFT_9361 [Rasamsonia byssochlamydoides]|uniref:uncharacterized protein n=1 Tax=Rasamsonia byssochlamydoides TaxID=89139 RepID=UPI00374235AA